MTNENKPRFNDEKYNLIKQYEDKDFFDILNAFNSKDSRQILKVLLDPYVSSRYRKLKNDEQKYGTETKQLFIDSLKGKVTSIKNGNRILTDVVKASKVIFLNIFVSWVRIIPELSKYLLSSDSPDVEIETADFLNLLIKGGKERKIPKEIIEKVYKFYPFLEPDEIIEQEINNLTYTYREYLAQDLKQTNMELQSELEILKKSIKEKDEQLLNNKSILEKYDKLYVENEENIKAIIKLQSEKLDLEILLEKNSDKVKELEYKIEDYKEKIKNLNEENNSLKRNSLNTKNIDIEKMKQSLGSKISDLEKENNNLKEENEMLWLKIDDIESSSDNKELINLKDKVKKLEDSNERLAKIRISELDQKIQSDKKYQQIILSLILNNSKAAKLVVKHLNLKEEVINEGYDYYDSLMLDKKIELEELNQKIKEIKQNFESYSKNIENIKSIPDAQIQYSQKPDTFNDYSNPYIYPLEYKFNYEEFFENLKTNFEKRPSSNFLSFSKFLQRFQKDTFFIVENDDILNLFDLGKYEIPFVRKSVETNWSGIKDWFGEFKDGDFVPSKTGISDYYSFVKNTDNLPFGFIIFDNFNIIPPELYILPFMEDLTHNGKVNLIHPSQAEKDTEYTTINHLANLKYILIKNSNPDTSFEISPAIKKYEL